MNNIIGSKLNICYQFSSKIVERQVQIMGFRVGSQMNSDGLQLLVSLYDLDNQESTEFPVNNIREWKKCLTHDYYSNEGNI